MASQPTQPVYYVAFLTTKYSSLEAVRQEAPEALAEHLERSKQLHALGDLVMAGAFLDRPGEPVSTMAVLTTDEAAKAFVLGDPFVRLGLVAKWEIRPWGNMLRGAGGESPASREGQSPQS